jgi:hypothetical protein
VNDLKESGATVEAIAPQHHLSVSTGGAMSKQSTTEPFDSATIDAMVSAGDRAVSVLDDLRDVRRMMVAAAAALPASAQAVDPLWERAYKNMVDPSVLKVYALLEATKKAIEDMPERIHATAGEDLYALSYSIIRGMEVVDVIGALSSCEPDSHCGHRDLPYFAAGRIEQPVKAAA